MNKTEIFFKVSNLNSNLALNKGYLNLALNNSAQDGRKQRTAYRLCVTNVTRLSLACFAMIFTNINVSWSFTKRSV